MLVLLRPLSPQAGYKCVLKPLLVLCWSLWRGLLVCWRKRRGDREAEVKRGVIVMNLVKLGGLSLCPGSMQQQPYMS